MTYFHLVNDRVSDVYVPYSCKRNKVIRNCEVFYTLTFPVTQL